jgi:lysozyme
VNEDLLEFIKRWEGLKLRSSGDPVVGMSGGVYKVYDVGYGHVIPTSCHPLTITREEAHALLLGDVVMIAGEVNDMVTTTILPQERDSLISLAYNIGVNALRRSTLLRYVNDNQFDKAADEFKKWNKSGPKIVLGLIKRRKAEEEMFRYGDYSGSP